MSTSESIYEGPQTQQSLATDVILAPKAPLNENKPRGPRSAYLPELAALLAERSISGPWYLKERNLNAVGLYRASGGFFDIFEDATGIMDQSVYRRVSALVARQFAK